ncbi:MAG TPA: hypothetical protein VGO93_03500 [Candidatus Xenobia bacterium]|jgi:hypothetical protein
MEPFRLDWQRLGADATQVKRDMLEKVDEQFEKVLEESAEPKEAAKDRSQPLQDAIQDHARERLAQSAPPAPGPVTSPQPLAPSPTHTAPQPSAHLPPTGLPVVVPDPAWQPPRPRELQADVHRVPRRGGSKRTEAVVDGELVEALRSHGLQYPIVSDDDRRLDGEAPFDTTWVRVGTEDMWSVTWRSPHDPGGTWQRSFISPTVLTVETVALRRMQSIEVKGDAVNITRKSEPPPSFEDAR